MVPGRPKTPMEQRDDRFIREIDSFTDEQWLIVCRRFTGDEKNIRALARKAGTAVSNLILSRPGIDAKYYHGASARLHTTIGKIPETMLDEGRPCPVRSISRGAIECGRCALKLLDDQVAAKDQKNLAVPLLRPFKDLVTLPPLDFETARRAPAAADHRKSRSAGKTPVKEGVFHLGFEESYFTFTDPPLPGVSAVPVDWYRKRFFHETWELPRRLEHSCAFGGFREGICAICGASPMHHLITIPVLPGFPVSGIEKVELVTCMSCLGWKEPVLYFTHQKPGGSHGIFHRDPSGPQEVNAGPPSSRAKPLRETRVYLCETPSRWTRQKWEESDDQNLNRIGGSPSWVQERITIRCSRCRKAMRFLLQLDSSLPLEDGARWLWGSGGLLYLFWCDECKIDAQFYQDS